ncbi:MAG TPA: hypothetical protein VFP84_39435 [Kofleriaceae bacterium]|nr:hypothetical protein [Kofleriaceae bacterium]
MVVAMIAHDDGEVRPMIVSAMIECGPGDHRAPEVLRGGEWARSRQ